VVLLVSGVPSSLVKDKQKKKLELIQENKLKSLMPQRENLLKTMLITAQSQQSI
jgi:hypothetical protein